MAEANQGRDSDYMVAYYYQEASQGDSYSLNSGQAGGAQRSYSRGDRNLPEMQDNYYSRSVGFPVTHFDGRRSRSPVRSSRLRRRREYSSSSSSRDRHSKRHSRHRHYHRKSSKHSSKHSRRSSSSHRSRHNSKRSKIVDSGTTSAVMVENKVRDHVPRDTAGSVKLPSAALGRPPSSSPSNSPHFVQEPPPLPASGQDPNLVSDTIEQVPLQESSVKAIDDDSLPSEGDFWRGIMDGIYEALPPDECPKPPSKEDSHPSHTVFARIGNASFAPKTVRRSLPHDPQSVMSVVQPLEALCSSLQNSAFITRSSLPSNTFESHARVFPSHAPNLTEGERSILGSNLSNSSLSYFSNQEKLASDALATQQHSQLMLSTLVQQLREGFEGDLPDHIGDLCTALVLQSFHQAKLVGALLASSRLKERDMILDSSSSLLSDVKKGLRILSPFQERLFPGDLAQLVSDMSKPTFDFVTQSTVSSILQAHQQKSAGVASAKSTPSQSATSASGSSAPARGRGKGKFRGRGRGKFSWRGRGRGRGDTKSTFQKGASQKGPN